MIPEFIPLEVAAWGCWLLPLVAAPFAAAFRKWKRALEVYAVIVAFVAAALAISLIPHAHEHRVLVYDWFPPLNLRMGVLLDPLAIFMANVAACIGALIVLYSVGYMHEEDGLPRYYFFILLFIGGMVGLVVAENLLQLYLFWEVVGLCSYALIGFWYRKESAANAGIKAFVVTRLGDCGLLAALLLIYFTTGVLSFTELPYHYADLRGLLPMIALLAFMGAVGKSAQVPLHVWLPDAMEGPTTVSALIHAATMVKAGVYLVARLYLVFAEMGALPDLYVYSNAVGYVGGITALLAATMGLVSNDIKRVLAYSTISQLGLMMTALGVATDLAWYAATFHILSHAMFKALLFLCAGAVMHAVHTTNMDEMGGLRHHMPVTWFTALVGALSLAGIPPFSGFFSKDEILVACWEMGRLDLFLLVVFTSILTVAYTLRWIYMVFLGEPRSHAAEHAHEAPPVMTVPLAILAAGTCAAGVWEAVCYGFHHFMLGPGHGALNPIVLLTSAAIILSGFIPAYLVYWRGGLDAARRIRERLHGLHTVLARGYFFDDVYYAIFERGLKRAASALYRGIEYIIFDRMNVAVAWAVGGFANLFRRTHTGDLNWNMSGVAIGMLVLILLILLLTG